MARTIWLACGLAWAFRSVLELSSPEYYEPVAPIDFVAVFGYSVALFLAGPAMLLLARLSSSTAVLIPAVVVAASAVLAGVANTVEDALDIGWLASVYIGAILVNLIATIAVAITCAIAGYVRLAVVLVVWTVGLVTAFTVVLGGLLMLAALVAVSIKPSWFSIRGRRDHASSSPSAS